MLSLAILNTSNSSILRVLGRARILILIAKKHSGMLVLALLASVPLTMSIAL